MNQVKTGGLIRAARLKNGMTQLQLAEKLSVSDKAVSKWERGCGCPDLSTLPLLADVLGMEKLQHEIDVEKDINVIGF